MQCAMIIFSISQVSIDIISQTKIPSFSIMENLHKKALRVVLNTFKEFFKRLDLSPAQGKQVLSLGLLFLMSISFSTTLIEPIPHNLKHQVKAHFGPQKDKSWYYGPIPFTYDLGNVSSYDYSNVHKSFGLKELWRSNELTKNEFEDLLISSIPKKMKHRAQKYIEYTLEVAHKHTVDPAWVLAIMWTESHFHLKAKSPVSARGLMQIMPKTGKYLAELLKWDISGKSIQEVTYHSNSNIEMGVFYLKKLLKKFRNNYKLATCAYNMGPGWVVNQLRNRRPVGIRNKYFNKVSKNYHRLVREMKYEFKKRIPPYQETYVARWKRRRPKAGKHMALPFGLPIDFASSQINNRGNRKYKRRSLL